jgi:hypothetical protein
MGRIARDATKQKLSFPSRSPFFSGGPLVVAFGILVCLALMAVSCLGTFLAFPLVVVVLMPRYVCPGVDGLLLKWFFWKRFIPYATLVEVRDLPGRACLVLASGETIAIGTWRFNHAWLLGWLRDELSAFRARAHAVDLTGALARGERPTEEWVRDARRLLDPTTAYRSAAITRDVLLQVAEDASAEETSRVGAAVALRDVMDDEDRRRVVAAAATSVSPRIRVALDAAVTADDDAAVVRALRVYER